MGIGFGDKPITMYTELDFAETDAGLCEVLWRVLREKTLAVPATLVRSLCEALDLPLEEGEGLTATPSSIQMNKVSLAGTIAQFMQFVDRAELLLVPVYGKNPGHWTLLAAQRTSHDPAAAASSVASSTSKGCPYCKHSSCQRCNPVTAERSQAREEQEAFVLQQLSRPVIMAATQWQLSYWDGLVEDHPDCLETARKVGQVILKSPFQQRM